MSRNLCATECQQCGSRVKITGPSYKYNYCDSWSVLLADAECEICGTQYSAWTGPTSDHMDRDINRDLVERGFYDLSYRSTFNDEPGDDDIPAKQISVFRLVIVDGRAHVLEDDL